MEIKSHMLVIISTNSFSLSLAATTSVQKLQDGVPSPHMSMNDTSMSGSVWVDPYEGKRDPGRKTLELSYQKTRKLIKADGASWHQRPWRRTRNHVIKCKPSEDVTTKVVDELSFLLILPSHSSAVARGECRSSPGAVRQRSLLHRSGHQGPQRSSLSHHKAHRLHHNGGCSARSVSSAVNIVCQTWTRPTPLLSCLRSRCEVTFISWLRAEVCEKDGYQMSWAVNLVQQVSKIFSTASEKFCFFERLENMFSEVTREFYEFSLAGKPRQLFIHFNS